MSIKVECAKPLPLAVRIPQWTQGRYNLAGTEGKVKDGYLHIEHTPSSTSPETTVQLDLPMHPTAIFPAPKARKHDIAFQRGPFIYCAESVDNTSVSSLDSVVISDEAEIRESVVKDLAGGAPNVPVLDVQCSVKKDWEEDDESLYCASKPEWETGKTLRLIPYFLRENRGGDGGMRVWFGRS